MKSKLSIKDLTSLIENEINLKIIEFNDLGKKTKETLLLSEKYKKEMYDIIKELEPVEYLVKNQNPSLCELFDTLKNEFEDKSIDTISNKAQG